MPDGIGEEGLRKRVSLRGAVLVALYDDIEV